QIFRCDRECVAMRRGTADQCTACLERRVQPFMGIERDRIGTLDPGNAVCVLRSDGDERTDTTVDVKPEVLLFRQVRESLQVIYRAGVYSPGRPNHACRLKTGRPILRDSYSQGGHIDPQVGICCYASESSISQPKRFHC